MWFADNPEAERLAGIIFDLRRNLFRETEFREAHEREWESEEQEKEREEGNAEALKKWDLETRRLILGTEGK